MKISSVNNELIKETAKLQQRKYRDMTGLFLLEGDKCVEEALNYGIKIKHLLVLEGYEKFANIENKIDVTENILEKLSTTVTPPKVVAVGEQPEYKWENNYKKVVLLDDIKDAGNLGTILRTCCAFNVDTIILYGDTVDIYNPKCVRASVGNLWKIPFFSVKNIDTLKELCKDFTPIATLPAARNTIMLRNFVPPSKILIMFGTESCGLSEELKKYADAYGQSVTIEMTDNVESLNLSISAGIILYYFFQST